MTTWCDGCNKPHPQTTTHLTDDYHLEYLCTPCYQWATYWTSIAPKPRQTAEAAA